jgi:hypothetical protein
MKEVGQLTMDMASDYIRFWILTYCEDEAIWYEKAVLLIAFGKNNEYFLDNMDSNWEITEIESVDGYCEL